MAIPTVIRSIIFEKLWSEADRIGWNKLTISEKTLQYKNWAQEDEIGGILSKYMSVERVHPYIKDSIMKSYVKNNRESVPNILRIAGFSSEEKVVKEYVKPFGILLESNEMIVWGRAVDWKIIMLSIYERTYKNNFIPQCVILNTHHGRFSTTEFRDLIFSSSQQLGIKSVIFD
jgi:hypothetical protein